MNNQGGDVSLARFLSLPLDSKCHVLRGKLQPERLEYLPFQVGKQRVQCCVIQQQVRLSND